MLRLASAALLMAFTLSACATASSDMSKDHKMRDKAPHFGAAVTGATVRGGG